MSKKLRQYELRSGTQTIVTFLDDLDLVVGSSVILKDHLAPDKVWQVVASYAVAEDKDLHNQNEGDNWNKHNNI